jgi:CHAD domain-containing protein
LRTGSRAFALDGDALASQHTLQAAAAAGGFGWTAGGAPVTMRRVWLDTFDWRLYRAGLTLEQVTVRGQAELVLTDRDGELVASQRLPSAANGTALRWPSLAAAVPLGPLREQLERAAGVRALCPVARVTSRLREHRVLNGDAKTIATVAVDEMAISYPARAATPPRLTVQPLRGYQAQAGRLAEALAASPGVTAASAPVLHLALAAAGEQPGEYQGKGLVGLAEGMAAPAAVAAVLLGLLDTITANVPGAVRDIDTEFLHDLRIAVRRTRTALKLAGAALPPGLGSRFRPEFRWLGDLTTPTRDLDVYLLDFDAMTAGLVGAEPDELAPLRDYLAARRAAAHRELARGLRSARLRTLTQHWQAELAAVPRARRKKPTAAQFAAATIARAQRAVLARGSVIGPASPSEQLHDLRKRCKELRYLAEMFSSLYDPAELWQAVRELKALQDCLGEFQDAEVQRHEIRAFAEQMVAQRAAPACTLLAMGEVAAGLAVRQQRARLEFDGRFSAFASPASQARLASLTERAGS